MAIFSLHSLSRDLGQLDFVEYPLHFHFKPDIALTTQKVILTQQCLFQDFAQEGAKLRLVPEFKGG